MRKNWEAQCRTPPTRDTNREARLPLKETSGSTHLSCTYRRRHDRSRLCADVAGRPETHRYIHRFRRTPPSDTDARQYE